MADSTVSLTQVNETQVVPIKAIDLGDNTYALSVSDVGGVPSVVAGDLEEDDTVSIAGDAVSRPYPTPTAGSDGQFLHNPSGIHDIWYKRVLVGGGSSTITATNKHGVIGPNKTASIELRSGFTLDFKCSSGSSAAVDCLVGEM